MAAVGVLVLALAACGSNLDPKDVAATNGGSGGAADAGGAAAGGADAGNGGDTAAGADPGTTGGDAGSGGATGGDTGAGGAGTGSTGGDAPAGDAPTEPAVQAPSGASCEGLKNQTGITDKEIVIGNSSDITGPVPGLFATAQDATTAFTAYFNASVPDGICGRKLKLINYDSRTDASGDQEQYTKACKEVFAMVGSVSAFDSGGAKTAQSCGLPDLRGGAVTQVRNDCTTCFGVQAVNTSKFENAVPDFVVKTVGAAGAKKAAFFYTNQGAAAENAQAQVRAMKKRGLDFPIVQGIAADEFNYASYVSALKEKKIEVVFFTTAYNFSVRMRQAMQQQGYTPKLYLRDPTDYNPAFVEQGGSAVDGTTIYTNFAPFEENNKEIGLYKSWLGQVKPGTPPLFFGVFAWSSARLFVELAAQLGGKLTRESLVAEVRKVDNWTANDMHAPQPVGSKGTGECWRFITLSGGTWKPSGGSKYSCTGLTATS
ncbi:ABC transporter substrate-binding protein [Nocardioides sp.]|uniref:ABC transporter substrate-binding protein n=1 Tax=Nocardioides sp. TaxID=35761 RepID=UPI00272756CB|nr:ABC transporter substrate-binding protein [Nocardioides sp.]MDO9455130.1 ABC transporter substrate-binding protein [Nocardioides sp.]